MSTLKLTVRNIADTTTCALGVPNSRPVKKSDRPTHPAVSLTGPKPPTPSRPSLDVALANLSRAMKSAEQRRSATPAPTSAPVSSPGMEAVRKSVAKAQAALAALPAQLQAAVHGKPAPAVPVTKTEVKPESKPAPAPTPKPITKQDEDRVRLHKRLALNAVGGKWGR